MLEAGNAPEQEAASSNACYLSRYATHLQTLHARTLIFSYGIRGGMQVAGTAWNLRAAGPSGRANGKPEIGVRPRSALIPVDGRETSGNSGAVREYEAF